ncbi:PPE family protein, SVP subgroup [Mycobacterium stomatepiae]|uniref:PPE family protein n=1 Tax=Mycobacterium stomatepiae TaxID=470076 RepID=A0A7I7QCG8_9MYCO|nr:PPE domain-containing protein [Mycobacterium stomatepiae]MCV7166852.1 PPE domain-containing protein [Mycobacterium stomatepiae]BBY23736.1 PPE family protein [Mycobacterium stomatepiae]
MDYALLPPEVNSARIYAGPGSGPMLAAASAWQTLAAELHSTASAYQAAITELTSGPWLGPAAAMMAAAAAPYVSWMRTAADQAEETGNRAIAAAAAYEAAFAETVPPPVVAANRAVLSTLVATNFLGQNTSAIAAVEGQYGEMWAQDTGAMQSYATQSAAATALTPFDSPSPNTSTDGTADQAAAVAQATGTTAGDAQDAVSSAQQAFSAVPNALINLASPQDAFGFGGRDLLGLLADLSAVFLDPELGATSLAADTTLGTTALPYDVGGYYTGVHTDDIVSGWGGVQPWPGNASAPPTTFPVLTNPPATVTGGFGHAPSVGRLSVPPGWMTAAPALRAATTALPAATAAAAAEATGSSAGSLFSQMALASMAGRAMAGTTGGGGARFQERIGMAAPKSKDTPPAEPVEVPQIPMGGPITSIAAELRKLASLRDAGILTQEEFVEQKQRLLPRDP